jgi:ATP-binding cassette subfamily B protein RaxB
VGPRRSLPQKRLLNCGIELRNVWFRYAEAEPFVLEDVCLCIEPGELVTIMGPLVGSNRPSMILTRVVLPPPDGP